MKMECPCKTCEGKGCGAYHEECGPYQAWKRNREEAKAWLQGQMPVTSEAGLKARNEKLKKGKGRKWNVKQRYTKD